MNKPCVSIVMPVYGVEKYLEKSIKSVLNQTFSDFELLLIDDCSPDKSGIICDETAKKDARIRVFHLEKNGRVSKARNFGIEKACGEFLLFLDSDDYIDANLLETAVASMRENAADVAVFGLYEEYENADGTVFKTNEIKPEKRTLKTKDEVISSLAYLEKLTLYGYPWNKLFNLEKLKQSGAIFPSMGFNEDIIFNMDFFTVAESCNILNFAPYHYAKRSGSTTGRYIPTYYKDIMLKIDRLYAQFEKFGILNKENSELMAELYVRYFFSSLERSFDKRAEITHSKRKEFFLNEIVSERYLKLKPYMSGSGLSGVMAKCFKSGNAPICTSLAWFIFFIKGHFPKFFESLSR